ncbi:hypothetical protein HWV62_343 [Athelia sp. TMB]|nr:hypothetical protein HWV62_343 [Athelia sp. TMB]
MSARPQRTPRPTAKAAASTPKNEGGRQSAAQTPSRISPGKRKAVVSSSPEVEIVDDQPSTPVGTPSPSKTRTRPSARAKANTTPSKPLFLKTDDLDEEESFIANLSPPPTPSPSKTVNRLVKRGPTSTQKPVATVTRRKQVVRAPKSPSPMDDYGGEAEEVTDPEFFGMQQNSADVVEPPQEYSSDEYWQGADSVHESDVAFIDDSARTEGGIKPKEERTTRQKPTLSKVAESSEDELSDYSRQLIRDKNALRKGKAVAFSQAQSESDGGDEVLNKHEIAELAEAKRQSLADSASKGRGIGRVGSSSSKLPPKKAESPDVFSSPTLNSTTPTKSKIIAIMDRSRVPVSVGSPMKVDNPTVYLEDLEDTDRGERSPAECQVKNVADEDKRISYLGLCYLLLVFGLDYAPALDLTRRYRWKELIGWSDAPHMGLATYSAWREQCADIDMEQLKKVFEFQGFRHILNASRTTPSNLARKLVLGGNHVLVDARVKSTIIQFTTILFVTEMSQLHSLRDVLGEKRRALQGVPQIVEWERMQSVLCMAFRIPRANIDMKAGAILFCTAKTMKGAASSSPAKNSEKFFKKTPDASSGASPFAGPKATVTGRTIIPILDARGATFNLESDLSSLDKKLPPFLGEIPEGSCVWVGYTCTKYEHQVKGSGLNFNLMWVVVLGTP